MRRQVPLIITFLVGVTMILAAFIPRAPFNRLDADLTDFFNILAAFAFVLGAGNLLEVHLARMSKLKKGWGFSAVTVFAFVFTLVVGIFKIGNPDGIKGELEARGSLFTWTYDYALAPLSSTMFSLLAFYVASASYRAFRAKNREATMLLLAAFFVLLGRTPLGVLITEKLPGSVEIFFAAIFGYLGWSAYRAKRAVAAPVLWAIAAFMLGRTIYAYIANATGGDVGFIRIPGLVNWIMLAPQLAGQRAIMIGICLGVISMSLRIILGVERSHLGSDTD
jgi:hypothetical protein